MKHLILLSAIAITACGSGTTNTVEQIARSNVVAFMGDSITAQWLPFMPTSADFTVINLGVHGETSAQMLARFKTQVIDVNPQVGVVVIEAGTNDFQIAAINGTEPNTNSISAMASMAKQAGIRVIIASDMLSDCASCGNSTTIGEFNSNLIALCQNNGYLYADYYDVMLTSSGAQDLSLYNPDGVHPDEAGYILMWAVVKPLIEEDLH